jgi:sugar lactone lactonase YvrE
VVKAAWGGSGAKAARRAARAAPTGGAGGAGGQAFDCSAIPSGPFVATQLATGFQGAEDLAFDGEGHIALKDGDKLVLLDAAGAVSDLASNVPDAYGLRFRADGHLVVALPGEAKLIDVAPDGTVVDLATGLGGPNGVHVDFDGTVYVTEFGGSKVTRVSPSGELTPLVTGSAAFAANGVVLDPARALLFFTNYQSGVIRSLDLSVPGASPVEVITLAGTAPDGLSLDACGHLYVVDQANADLYRVRLDRERRRHG